MLIVLAVLIIGIALGVATGWAARQQETPERNPFHGPKNPLCFRDDEENDSHE